MNTSQNIINYFLFTFIRNNKQCGVWASVQTSVQYLRYCWKKQLNHTSTRWAVSKHNYAYYI